MAQNAFGLVAVVATLNTKTPRLGSAYLSIRGDKHTELNILRTRRHHRTNTNAGTTGELSE